MQASNSERSRFKSSDANQHQNVVALEENEDLQSHQKMQLKQAIVNKRDPANNVDKSKGDLMTTSTFNDA